MKLKLVALAAAVVLMASACTLRETKDFEVKTGAGTNGPWVQMVMKEGANTGIAVSLFRDICKWSPVCVGNFLTQNTNIEGWGAAQWYEGLKRHDDLYNSLVPVYRSIAQWSSPTWFYEAPICLTLRQYWNGALDWTEWGTCGAYH